MKNRKFFVGTTGAVCIIFCLFLPFYFGLQFLLPILMPEETSSEISEDILTPDECSPLEAWALCQDALSAAGDFTTKTDGYIDTQILFFNYRQLISNTRSVSGGNVFLQNMNTGTLLNAGLQQYFDGEKAYLRPCTLEGSNHVSWADAPVAVSMGTYYDAFGPVSDGLSAYLFSERTLVTGFYLYENDGVYSFSFELSAEAALYYARSLRTLCQLDGDPVFKSIEITLDMDAQFRPLRVEYEEEYTITLELIGETTCKASYAEIFSFQDVAISEKAFFDSFASMEAGSTIPKLSTGYNFLFSLFGNTNTYDALLTVSGKVIPLALSFDTNDNSLYAVGENLSLVYSEGQYYFSIGDSRLCSRSDAFNEKLQPIMLSGTPSETAIGGASLGSAMDNVSIQTEQGKLIVSSSTPGQTFRVTMDTASMVIEEFFATLSLSGKPFTLYMKQAPSRAEKPALVGYSDITNALDSLDILLELTQQPNTYYHVTVSGAQSMEADVVLSLNDGFSLYAVSRDETMPFELFLKNDAVTVLLDEISVSGTPSEFESLLACFTANAPVTLTQTSKTSFDCLITVEEERIVLYVGNEADQKLILCGSYCLYESGETLVRITKTGYGDETAKEPPLTQHNVSAADLCAFLEGSVYPELITAGTIYADLVVRIPEGRFDVDMVLTTSPETTMKIDTALYGKPFTLYYKDEDLYFCHTLFNAFVPADKLASVFAKLQGTSGGSTSASSSSSGSQEATLESISVESHQIQLVFDSYTLFLTKDSFRLVGEGTTIRSKALRGEADVVAIDCPSKEDCIDLEDLVRKLSCLQEQTRFAFTGNYSNDMMAAVISRLDVEFSEDGDISCLAAEAVVSSAISQAVKIYYDQGSVYMDIGGLKLFAYVDKLLSQPDSVPDVSAGGGTVGTAPFGVLSTLESITYTNGTLTVVTRDATISITWAGDELDVIRYRSGSNSLLLVACEQQEIIMPNHEEYTDVTELGGLLIAAWNTANAGSFRFDGNLDLKIFSQTVENVSISGAVSTKDGSLAADLSFTVPYVPGVSSANVPLLYHQKLLQDCEITNQVLIVDGNVYMTKVICGTYGTEEPETLLFTDKRWISLESLQKDPAAALIFLFNLEKDISLNEEAPSALGGEPSEPFFSQTPFRDIRKEGDGYVIEISPDVLPDVSDELVFRANTDGRRITKLKTIATLSVFTIEANTDIYDHGKAVVPLPEKESLSEYLPLQG